MHGTGANPERVRRTGDLLLLLHWCYDSRATTFVLSSSSNPPAQDQHARPYPFKQIATETRFFLVTGKNKRGRFTTCVNAIVGGQTCGSPPSR
mmetsp:Transcript_18368/g.42536  ORF Transcript_18368/g.42536 Transcript_18368/m.42536 type:complete len:93 (+) Transcript_18368:300-578(+)